MSNQLTPLSGWGRYPIIDAHEVRSEELAQVCPDAVLTRGMGRSYGDASLPPQEGDRVANSALANRLLAFDPATGVLRAEAGFSLLDLNRFFVPRGFATPVSPGTQFVSLGGMVAADVHGKNHHVSGCFGEHVQALRMLVADGRVLEVSQENEPDLFLATLGGMGLTGHILDVEFRLQSIPTGWIWAESERVQDLDELVTCLRESSAAWPYTMSWLDTTTKGRHAGRGIIMRGRWARPDEAPPNAPRARRGPPLPFDLPNSTLNPFTIAAFNTAYFHKHSRRMQRGIVHPWTFFYPLDAIDSWNRAYGRRGFIQYQCVLPVDQDRSVVHRFFEAILSHRAGSIVTVVKDCGEQGRGILSFPKSGISIALDLPVRAGETQKTVDAFNEIVLSAGGRIYLAKDAMTRPEHFRAMEPRLDHWNDIRRKWDPRGKLRSALSARLFGDAT